MTVAKCDPAVLTPHQENNLTNKHLKCHDLLPVTGQCN